MLASGLSPNLVVKEAEVSNPQSTLQTIAQSRIPLDTELDAQGVIEIVAPDLNAMLSFYEALGFRVERRTGPFAVLSGFGMRIFLAENPGATTGKRWANVRVVVPDVDLIWKPD